MTDNEIIKALKSEIHLAEYIDNNYCDNIDISLIQSAINSINRLQAKVIKEQNKNSKLRNERNHLQAEIERLNELLETRHKVFETKCEELEIAKAEAYKEFAERLKELDGYDNHTFDDCVSLLVPDEYIKGRYEKINEIWNTIDNLVKEMVGEDND